MSILSIASNASVWRGYEYYNEKKVLSWKQTEEHKFEGEVAGSEKEPYHVMIDTEHPKKSKCNCPHAEGKKVICKHNYRDGIKFTWTNERMLATLDSNNYTVNYKYNLDGLRTEKKVLNKLDGSISIVTYYYDNGNLIKEKSNNNTIWYIYDANNYLRGFELNDTAYYYERNIFGDITKILSSNGTEAASYTYDAWGNITSIIGDTTLANINPYRYCGYYYDQDSGFYYLQSRYIGDANYLGRHLIVSAKVRDLFIKNKIRPIAYEPVRIKCSQ